MRTSYSFKARKCGSFSSESLKCLEDVLKALRVTIPLFKITVIICFYGVSLKFSTLHVKVKEKVNLEK